MTSTVFRFDFEELDIKAAHVEKILGYETGASDVVILKMIEEMMIEASSLISVKAEYRIFQDIHFDDFSKSLTINDQVFNIQKIIYEQLKDADAIAIFLCTAGEGIVKRSREEMNAGDMLRGYIFDILGSNIVESAAELLQNELEKEASAAGRRITDSFSPGYCKWDVSEQHKLFRLMQDNYCGIRLTESALMNPEKSVSGFIGIGERVKKHGYTCGFCEMENCIFRRANI